MQSAPSMLLIPFLFKNIISSEDFLPPAITWDSRASLAVIWRKSVRVLITFHRTQPTLLRRFLRRIWSHPNPLDRTHWTAANTNMRANRTRLGYCYYQLYFFQGAAAPAGLLSFYDHVHIKTALQGRCDWTWQDYNLWFERLVDAFVYDPTK